MIHQSSQSHQVVMMVFILVTDPCDLPNDYLIYHKTYFGESKITFLFLVTCICSLFMYCQCVVDWPPPPVPARPALPGVIMVRSILFWPHSRHSPVNGNFDNILCWLSVSYTNSLIIKQIIRSSSITLTMFSGCLMLMSEIRNYVKLVPIIDLKIANNPSCRQLLS